MAAIGKIIDSNPVVGGRTTNQILDTWKDGIFLKKEDITRNIKGLRSPQIGAVYAVLSHWEISSDPATVVMPTGTGKTEVIKAGENADALAYELADMEKAINGDPSCMHLDYTKDVMDMMTEFRKSWKFTYPEEE